MSDDACRIGQDATEDEAAVIERLLLASRIAVVGLSDNPSRPSYGVASYLLDVGKEILPVNPNHDRALGLKCYGSLEEVLGPVDLVNVFRRPEYCTDVTRSPIAIQAKGIWLQSGIISPKSRELARRAGVDYVEDRCIMVEYANRRKKGSAGE